MRVFLCTVLSAFGIACVSAREEPFVEVTSTDGTSTLKYYPERLDPVLSDDWLHDYQKRYRDLLTGRLKTGEPFFARLIICPSFTGESCLRIHGAGDETAPEQSEQFQLTYTAADKSLYFSMPENNETTEKRVVKVTTTQGRLPAPLGKRICRIFEQLLQRPKNEIPGGGLDGTTYEFATPSAQGEVWCPPHLHIAAPYLELATHLIECCGDLKAGEKERILKVIDEKVAEIEKRLQAAPKN